MLVKVSDIHPNKFRDMDKYPINETKVAALVESIQTTDFWDNVLARPLNNQVDGVDDADLVEHLKGLSEADFPVELAYGHHRLEAIKRCGIDEINIPVKQIDDEIMLKIMANENKGDWASNMSVILETVRQVRENLKASVDQFDTFEDYVEAGYSFFNDSKAFAAAKKDIGFRKIRQFLGETWAENDIRAASTVLSAIDEGMYPQEYVIGMPSIGAMNRYHTLCQRIAEQSGWPQGLKDRYIKDCADIISDPDRGATVKIINGAANAVKKGNLPVDYLLKQKYVPFALAKELQKMLDADKELTVDDFLQMDGFKDFEGLDEAVEEVKEKAKRDAERRANAGGAGEDEAGEGEAGEGSDDQADVEAAIAGAEGEAAAVADGSLPDLEDGTTSIVKMMDVITQSSSIFAQQIGSLRGKIGGMSKKQEERFHKAFGTAYTALVHVGMEAYGIPELKAMIDQAEASA